MNGYNTGLGVSQPFQLRNRPPQPYIVSPGLGQMVPAGQSVLLRGGADDAEDGGLANEALRWTVAGRDEGSGQERMLGGLAPGEYDVALAARDSAQDEGTARARLTVGSLTVPVSASPALDGVCDDPTYAGAAALYLSRYGDGDQASVRLLRTDTDLWACFAHMARGSSQQGSWAGDNWRVVW